MTTASVTKRSVTHATFIVERVYDASPAHVFRAWADPEVKRRWASCHDDWKTVAAEFDFRVGGREINHFMPKDGPMLAIEAVYQDIVPNQRIVFSYDMRLGESRISVSLATVEFISEGKGTRLTFTEQGAFLDGFDDVAGREQGTGTGLDRLGAILIQETAIA